MTRVQDSWIANSAMSLPRPLPPLFDWLFRQEQAEPHLFRFGNFASQVVQKRQARQAAPAPYCYLDRAAPARLGEAECATEAGN